jgi:hypothetical protein
MTEYLNARWEALAQFEVWATAARLFRETSKPYDPWTTSLHVLVAHRLLGEFTAFMQPRKDA